MKKFLVLLLTLAMIMTGFTACGNDDTDNGGDDVQQEVQNPDDNADDDGDVEDDGDADDDGDTDEDKDDDAEDKDDDEDKSDDDAQAQNKPDKNNSSSDSNKTDKTDKTDKNDKNDKTDKDDKDDKNDKNDKDDKDEKPKAPSGTPSEIIAKIYEENPMEIAVGDIELDLGNAELFQSFTGLSSTDKIEAATASEAMMNAQAYSMVMIRVKDSKDTKALAQAVLDGVDPNKWVCVTAEDVRVAAYDDLIMLVMDSEYADTKAMVATFKKLCGGELDFNKKR